jgi:hypothetical protein
LLSLKKPCKRPIIGYFPVLELWVPAEVFDKVDAHRRAIQVVVHEFR